MEPDLDRLIDFESGGGLFPQFNRDGWSRSISAACALADRTIRDCGRRPRVALQSLDSQTFSAVFLAFARCEVDLFLFNPSWGRAELATAQRVADPHLQISDGAGHGIDYKYRREAVSGAKIESGRNKLRVMVPTGGTSGQIRFAIHDWSTLAAATYGFQQHVGCGCLATHCVLPLYHVSGFMQLVRALLTMGKIVYGTLQGFSVNHQLLREVRKEDRFLSLVGTQLTRLVKEGSALELLREYSAIFIGGGPVSIGMLDECRKLKLPLAPTYGMTETAAQVATLMPDAFLAGENSQGRVLPHVKISIVSEEMSDKVCEVGERGMIRIGGTSLFRGYFGDLSEFSEAAILTSDLGHIDAAGRLWVLGRSDRVVISGGEKVNLREVELAAENSGMLEDVVAFGVEDREWGERLALAYVPKAAAFQETELRDYLKQELADYKVPKTWVRTETIPRNEAGKPLLSQLRENA